jgi:hypothetical protein
VRRLATRLLGLYRQEEEKKTSEEKKQLWGQDLSLNKLLNIDFG